NSPLTSIPHEMSGPMPQLLKKHKNRFKAKESDIDLVHRLRQWAKEAPCARFRCNNVEYVTDYPGFGRQHRKVYEQIESILAEAKNEVLMETPYFITMEEGQKALADAET